MTALPVILNILKITGIVLACIIGFVLFLLLLVLFVPVRYNVKFARTGEEEDPPVDARGHVSWLLHLIHISAGFNGELKVTVRVFGIPVKRIPEDEEKKRKKEEKKRKKEEKKNKRQDKDADESDETTPGSVTEAENNGAGGSEEEPVSAETEAFLDHEGTGNAEGSDECENAIADGAPELSDEDSDADNTDPEDTRAKKSIFSRIKDLVNKILYTIRDTCDKIKRSLVNAHDKKEELSKNIHYYLTILESELFERTFAKCKKKVLRLIKEIVPRRGEVNLEVGFEDPYTTGEVLAIAGILYPYIGHRVHVNGNFEQEIIRGAGYFRGRIYVFSLVKILLYYLFNRDLKKLIGLFKKEKPKKHKGRRADG